MPRESSSAQVLERHIREALCRPVPRGVLAGSANAAREYTDLAHELQQFLVGKRPEVAAAEALRRFEARQ